MAPAGAENSWTMAALPPGVVSQVRSMLEAPVAVTTPHQISMSESVEVVGAHWTALDHVVTPPPETAVM